MDNRRLNASSTEDEWAERRNRISPPYARAQNLVAMLYPLIFHPILQQRVWGGRALERLFHKDLPPAPTPIGESWEISDQPDAVSVIANGPLAGKDLRFLMDSQRDALLGESSGAAGRFPLLIKLLDAQQPLSLHVHPPASIAAFLNGHPKTEMWYVAEARPNSELLAGLKRGITREGFAARLTAGFVADCFHRLHPKAGDALFLPAGRVHALGAGCVVLEIQQNSDTTFRVFDWNRLGLDGKPRPLHLEQALQCIDFTDSEPELIHAPLRRRRGLRERTLVNSPMFQVDEWHGETGAMVPFSPIGRPTIVGVVSGHLKIHDQRSNELVRLGAGQFCLIPACVEDVDLYCESSLVCLMTRPGVTVQPRRERESIDLATPAAPWEVYAARAPSTEISKSRVVQTWERLKGALSQRFSYSPLIQLAITSVWVRLMIASALCFVLFLTLFLPKIWRVTPPGFLPVVRISGLDRAQAFMLGRSAQQATSEKRYAAAAYAWQAALANNPADPNLVRGEIRTALQNETSDPQNSLQAVRNSFWLLKLTNTNRDDLELCVKLYERLNLYSVIGRLLEPLSKSLSGPLEASYMKMLFFQQDWSSFESRWQARTAAGQNDPELSLFWWAYRAGWKSDTGPVDAFGQLEATASGHSPSALIANRLMLVVCLQRQASSPAETALRRLESAGSDRVTDHTLYWATLAADGKKDEAKRLAEAFTGEPTTAVEANALVQSLLTLDLGDRALRLLQERLSTLGAADELWVTLANLLIERQRWDDLRVLAVKIRDQESVRDELEAYSYYLEGRAAIAGGRSAPAQAAFDQAVAIHSPNPSVALIMAKGLLKLEYPAQAKALLAGREKELGEREDYWQTVFDVGLRLKDPDFVVEGARRQYEAHPGDLTCVNRYAAALLATRLREEEAVKLTLELVRASPNSLAAVINHSMALLLNHRTNEAAALLDRVDPDHLHGGESAAYHLAFLELCLQRGRHELARQELAKIPSDYLFPRRKAWLDQCQLALRSP